MLVTEKDIHLYRTQVRYGYDLKSRKDLDMQVKTRTGWEQDEISELWGKYFQSEQCHNYTNTHTHSHSHTYSCHTRADKNHTSTPGSNVTDRTNTSHSQIRKEFLEFSLTEYADLDIFSAIGQTTRPSAFILILL